MSDLKLIPTRTLIRERKRVLKLADQLFKMVEKHQGYFHVSDGECFDTTELFFERIRGRLEQGEKAVSQMQTFLALHGQLKE